MFDATALTIHVVFVPGTVRNLSIFLPSLAAWGHGCRFRLVSNGCSAAEDQSLREIVTLSQKFDFVRLPTRGMWEHGDVLNYLQRQENGARFAFLDSDIFATGDFLSDLFSRSGPVAALFSCPPIWSNDQLKTIPQDFKLACGHYQQMQDGFCIGGSYFAIYDNRLLHECMNEYGIDLRACWWEQIPKVVQKRLAAAGRTMTRYDTTKLVNILLNLDGHSCQFLETRFLHHVGGVSCHVISHYLRQLMRNWISKSIPAIIRRTMRQVIGRSIIREGWRQSISSDEFRSLEAEIDRREDVCAHISRMLRTLEKGRAFNDDYASGDGELDGNVRRLQATIGLLYPTWRAWLDGRDPIAVEGFSEIKLFHHRPDDRDSIAA